MEKRKKEEGKMKRLTMAMLVLIALTTGAVAHQGSIGIYYDLPATDCDADFVAYAADDVYIMYYSSDSGPDGITAAQFKVDFGLTGTMFMSFTPSPSVSVTLGDILNGFSVSFVGCTGTGDDYLLIGTMQILTISDETFTIRVLKSDDIDPADLPVDVRVTICEGARPSVAVLGGWFVGNGSCDIGTEEKSWGAIKEMYND